MKLIDKIQSFFNSVKSETITLIERDPLKFLNGFSFAWGDRSVNDYLQNAYGSNPYFYMVIDSIAGIGSRLPIKLINTNTGQEIQNNELTLLLDDPNARDNFQEMLYKLLANQLTTGESFLTGLRPIGMSKYGELIAPTVSNVEIVEDKSGNIQYYGVNYFNDYYQVEPVNMLHIKKPNIICDSNRGFSALHAGAQVYKSNNAVWESEASLHTNKGISGVLYADGNRVLTPKEQQALQSEYDGQYTGVKKFGKVKVSTSKLGFLQMGMNPNDLKSIETRIEHLRTACALFGVASQLYGDTSASTYNNMYEAKLARYTDVILPLVDNTLNELNKWLIVDNFGLNDVSLIIDKEQIDILKRPNFELSTKLINEVNAGIITPQEAKEILYPKEGN